MEINNQVTLLTVHVQPRASRDEVVGWHGEAVKLRLAAPPVEGEANRRCCEFLAEKLAVSRRQVELVAGEKSRQKTIRITGLSREEVLRRLGLS